MSEQSLSGSSALPSPAVPTVKLFDRFGKPIKPIGPHEQLARARALKRRTQLEVEQLALEYARIMLERDIYNALELEKTNPELAAKLRGRIMDRAVGRVRDEVADEERQRAKGDAATGFLEVLAAVSRHNNQLAGIGHTPGAPVLGERDVTPIEHDPGSEWFEYPTSTTEVDDHE